MDESLPPEMYYHDRAHTASVVEATEWLCEMELVPLPDAHLLRIAALFHDVGFIDSYDDHEEKSIQISKTTLKKYPFTATQIQQISQLIQATKLSHRPQTLNEMIICDADLHYLGGNYYFVISNLLRKELSQYGKLDANEPSWDKFQLRFLESHQYFTNTAKRILEPVKQSNIKLIKDRLKINHGKAE